MGKITPCQRGRECPRLDHVTDPGAAQESFVRVHSGPALAPDIAAGIARSCRLALDPLSCLRPLPRPGDGRLPIHLHPVEQVKHLIPCGLVITGSPKIGDVPLDLAGQPPSGRRLLGTRLEPGAVDRIQGLTADLVQPLDVETALAIPHRPELLGLVHVLQGFPERLFFALLGLEINRRGLRAFLLEPVEALTKLPGFPDRPPLGLRRPATAGYIAVLPRLPFFFICGGRPTGFIGAIFGTFAIVGVFVEDFVFSFFDLIVAAIPEL